MYKKILLIFLSAVLSIFQSWAHGVGAYDYKFIENKGQWEPQVLFRSSLSVPGSIHLVKDGLVYNFAHPDDWGTLIEESHDNFNSDVNVRMHAYKIKFLQANSTAKKAGYNPTAYYQNYFLGNDTSKWASRVQLFENVALHEVYNGISLALYREGADLKYDFIVKPGANPQSIQLGFEGVKPHINEKGQLVIPTSVSTVIEDKPLTYQMIEGNKVIVESEYRLSSAGVLSFHLPQGYDPNYDLVIDPRVIFSTYSGAVSSGSVSYSHSSTCDFNGHMYAVAYAFNTGWPTTMGAFQQNFAGSSDVGINKIWQDGTRLEYSTYYGGSSSEVPLTSRVNSSGELLIGGSTSSNNLPVTAGAFKTTHSGATELFLASFSEDGDQLLGGSYFGNNSRSGMYFNFPGVTLSVHSFPSHLVPGMEINFDINNNIWMVCNVENATNIPVSSNAFQLNKAAGFDVVIVKFTPDLSSIMYSSFLGGNGDEAVHGIELLSSGNPVIVGATTSTDFPIVGSSPYMSAPTGGALSGFAVVLDESTGQLTHATYIATNGNDIVSRVDVDKYDQIFVLGRTNGDFLVTPGAFTNTSPATVSSTKLFILKLNTTLSTRLLSTAFAGGSITPGAFIVDDCSNIYFTSMGAGAGMPMSIDAFQTTTDDLWFAALSGNMQNLIFGTYYGDPQIGDHCHTGTNRFDKQGRIYHSICVVTNSWPTTPASYAPIKLSSGYDVASFKFDFEKAGVSAAILPDRNLNPIDSGCVPHTVNLDGSSPQAVNYYWDFGDGNFSNIAAPTHTYTQPGAYTIMLVASNDSLCITHDTAYLDVVVYDIATPILLVSDTNLCVATDSLLITVDVVNPSNGVPGNVFRWNAANPGAIYGLGNTQSVWVNPSVANAFTVTVLDSAAAVCVRSATATVNVNMSPRVLEILTPDTAVCEGSVVNIRARGSDGYTYRWSPAIGINDTTALEPAITVNQSQLYMVTASFPFCIDTSDLINITMHEYPEVEILAPQEACEDSEVQLRTRVTPFRNDYSYTWEPSSILNSTSPSLSFYADTVDRFYVVKVETPIGCSGTDSAFIVLHNRGTGDAISGIDYCAPGSAQLWASNGVSYEWSPTTGLDNPYIANPVTTTNIPTNYEVYITNENGCIDTLQVVVDVHPRAVLSIPEQVTVYEGGSGYQVVPETNALHFEWFPPSGVSDPRVSDPVLNPVVRTRYVVNAKTEFGCEVVDSIDVLVGEADLKMPNAYTPGNTNAPLFKPVIQGGWELKSFKVFNRWGAVIYETNKVGEGWDGTYKGEAQPFGVYVWAIDAVSSEGKSISQTGNVTLVR